MKKNLSYRDKLIELAEIYKISEIQLYERNKKYLTTAQIELILKKNKVPIPTELKKNIFEKIEWICNPENRKNIDRIRYNGYRLILDKHSNKNRYNLIKDKINSISLF